MPPRTKTRSAAAGAGAATDASNIDAASTEAATPLADDVDAETFGEAFAATLRRDFLTHGHTAIAKLRDEKPADYLKVIAALQSKHAEAANPDDRDDGPFARLSDAKLLDALALVRALAGARDEAGD